MLFRSHAVLIGQGIVELSGAVENIGRILLLCGIVQRGFRLPEDCPELDSSVGKPMAQDMKQMGLMDFPAEAGNDLLFTVGTVDFPEPLPLPGLALLDELYKGRGVQGQLTVKGSRVAHSVAALGGQVVGDVLFKTLFPYIEIIHALVPLAISLCASHDLEE